MGVIAKGAKCNVVIVIMMGHVH